MDYNYCKEILEEDSSEGGHPNIDSRTLKKWKQDRKEQIRNKLEERKEQIKDKKECVDELNTIKNIIRETIIEIDTYIDVPSNPDRFDAVVLDTEKVYMQRIFDEICYIGNPLGYIEAIRKAFKEGDPKTIDIEIEEYLHMGMKVNIEKKYYTASIRMAQCLMALEYVRMKNPQISSSILESICTEGYSYHQKILDFYNNKCKKA